MFISRFAHSTSSVQKMHPVLRQTGMSTEWNLTEIPMEDRAALRRKLLEPFYETLRQDMIKNNDSLDYPLVETNGVICWKPDPLICALEKEEIIDLEHLNLITNDDPNLEKALYKRLGSSLGGYTDLLRGMEQAQ